MFCPICRSEYRAGFTICSDCNVSLVTRIPESEEPAAYVVLWSGEGAAFQERLLGELERAQIGAAGIPLYLLFRHSIDEFGISRGPLFGFAVCVQNANGPAARRILEKLLEQAPREITPEPEAIPLSWAESAAIPDLPLHWNSKSATVCVWKGNEEKRFEFLESSLHGVGIPTLRETDATGSLKVMVRPSDEPRAREVLLQIETHTVPQEDSRPGEDYFWQDQPIESYRLLWMVSLPFLVLVILSYDSSSLLSPSSFLSALFAFIGFIADIGWIWMLYQAIRFEIRPLRFVLISLLPLSFIWYYFERYAKRAGIRRLPIAVRVRMSPRTPA